MANLIDAGSHAAGQFRSTMSSASSIRDHDSTAVLRVNRNPPVVSRLTYLWKVLWSIRTASVSSGSINA
jgi:hypothetical protein